METQKLKIPYPIIVEGRYDRIRVGLVADATVLETSGFGIFRNEDKKALLKKLSEKTRLIVLTDSDSAGRLIRSHLHGFVPPDRLIEVYIPQIPGVEKRKKEPSAEGLLGVEGMEPEKLYNILKPYESLTDAPDRRPVTKADLYEAGLTGHRNSAEKRDELAVRLELPKGMTPNAFLTALNLLTDYDTFTEMTKTTSD